MFPLGTYGTTHTSSGLRIRFYDKDRHQRELQNQKSEPSSYNIDVYNRVLWMGSSVKRGELQYFQARRDHWKKSPRSAGIVPLPAFQTATAATTTSSRSRRSAIEEELTTAVTPENEFRRQLVDFYKKHNPEKLDSVESTLLKYKGKEAELFERLRSKYERANTELEPLPEDTSGPKCFLVFPQGRVTVQLFKKHAPLAVENFRCLCTGEKGIGRKGAPLCYRGSHVHRIVPNFCIQMGDFTDGNGTGGESIYQPSTPGVSDMWGSFIDEKPMLPVNRPGLVAMANNGPNRNGSQFFITLRALPHLTGKHVVFGYVEEGFDVVKQISLLQPPVQILDCNEVSELKPNSMTDRKIHVTPRVFSFGDKTGVKKDSSHAPLESGKTEDPEKPSTGFSVLPNWHVKPGSISNTGISSSSCFTASTSESPFASFSRPSPPFSSGFSSVQVSSQRSLLSASKIPSDSGTSTWGEGALNGFVGCSERMSGTAMYRNNESESQASSTSLSESNFPMIDEVDSSCSSVDSENENPKLGARAQATNDQNFVTSGGTSSFSENSSGTRTFSLGMFTSASGLPPPNPSSFRLSFGGLRPQVQSMEFNDNVSEIPESCIGEQGAKETGSQLLGESSASQDFFGVVSSLQSSGPGLSSINSQDPKSPLPGTVEELNIGTTKSSAPLGISSHRQFSPLQEPSTDDSITNSTFVDSKMNSATMSRRPDQRDKPVEHSPDSPARMFLKHHLKEEESRRGAEPSPTSSSKKSAVLSTGEESHYVSWVERSSPQRLVQAIVGGNEPPIAPPATISRSLQSQEIGRNESTGIGWDFVGNEATRGVANHMTALSKSPLMNIPIFVGDAVEENSKSTSQKTETAERKDNEDRAFVPFLDQHAANNLEGMVTLPTQVSSVKKEIGNRKPDVISYPVHQQREKDLPRDPSVVRLCFVSESVTIDDLASNASERVSDS